MTGQAICRLLTMTAIAATGRTAAAAIDLGWYFWIELDVTRVDHE
jgi:hypothetical protein